MSGGSTVFFKMGQENIRWINSLQEHYDHRREIFTAKQTICKQCPCCNHYHVAIRGRTISEIDDVKWIKCEKCHTMFRHAFFETEVNGIALAWFGNSEGGVI